jgi:AraC-like DNA-binding protein
MHVRPGQVHRLPLPGAGLVVDLNAEIVLFTASFLRGPASIALIIDDLFGAHAWDLAPRHTVRSAGRCSTSAPSTGARGETFQRFQNERERSFAITRHVSEYAARLGYSAKTVTRACQAATGHSAKELINVRVVLEAKRLLAHTDLPAATIGHRLGFVEPTNFSKFFTNKTGHTPGAFRSSESL